MVMRRRAEERVLKSFLRESARWEVETWRRTLEGRSRPIACAVLSAAATRSSSRSSGRFVSSHVDGDGVLLDNDVPPSALRKILDISWYP